MSSNGTRLIRLSCEEAILHMCPYDTVHCQESCSGRLRRNRHNVVRGHGRGTYDSLPLTRICAHTLFTVIPAINVAQYVPIPKSQQNVDKYLGNLVGADIFMTRSGVLFFDSCFSASYEADSRLLSCKILRGSYS